MAKKSKDEGFPYFKFAISKWSTGNIQQCSHTSQGLFMNICALYWGQRGELILSKMLKRFPRRQKYFDELISEDVIKIIGDTIEVSFLDEQMTELGMVSEQNRNSANKRWNQTKSDASASKPQCENDALDMPREEKREEEKREEESEREIPHELNFKYQIGSEEVLNIDEHFKERFPIHLTNLKMKYGELKIKKWIAEFSSLHNEKTWKDDQDFRSHISNYFIIQEQNGNKITSNRTQKGLSTTLKTSGAAGFGSL